MSSLDYLELCRLCLVKENVELPIFEDDGEARQIFFKISACLPVKVARDDKLPKKICDQCGYKVELLYQFWNTTVNAEKQLLQWLGEVGGLEDKQGYITEVLDSNVMKQERGSDSRLDGSVMQVAESSNIDINMIDNMSIITMPDGSEQQFTTVPIEGSTTVQVVAGSSTQEQANVGEEEEEEEEDNFDDGCDNDDGMTVKEETEDDQNERSLESTFVNVSMPCDEAGPSGLQQKITNMSEITPQTADGDSKPGRKTSPLRTRASKRQQRLGYSPGSTRPLSQTQRTKTRRSNNCKEPSERKVSRRRNPEVTPKKPKKIDDADEADNDNDADQEKDDDDDDDEGYFNSEPSGSRFDCLHCGQSFGQRKQLRAHVAQEHGGMFNKYTCDTCECAFKCRQSLREHVIRKHTEGYRFACEACGKKFKMKSDMYMHVQSIHGDDREVVCDVCGKTYRNSFALKKHLAHAHNQRPYSCDKCKRRLATKESLEQHALLHLRKERAVCQICGKTFSGNDALKKHMRIHTGVRPFPCKVCGKTFRRQNTHKQHLLTHTGQKPYVCDICGKAFTQKPGLITHRKKHPGPLPPLPTISIDYFIADLMDKSKKRVVIDE